MSPEETFAIGRVVERLMICAFAGLCLTYGWNLFRVGVLNEQSAELSAKGWRFNLKRVGPGVFFALFGSVILSISLRSPLALPSTNVPQGLKGVTNGLEDNKDSACKDQSEVVYLTNQDEGITRRWVADLNTVLHVETAEEFPDATKRKVVARTNEDLETLRDALVIKRFGASLFRDYITYKKRVGNEDTPGTQEERDKFAQIDGWMQGNRIQE